MVLGELSLLINIFGGLPYIVQIVRGNVRPERMSWFVWSLILGLAIWSYRSSGATNSLWFLVGDCIVTTVIFLLSLWRGKGGWTRLDIVCLLIAASSLLLWQATSLPLLSLGGVLVADAVALVPTLVKSLQDPGSESASTFCFSSLAAVFGFVSVGEWNLLLLFYPAYLFLANFVTAVTICVGKYQVRHLAIRKGISR